MGIGRLLEKRKEKHESPSAGDSNLSGIAHWFDRRRENDAVATDRPNAGSTSSSGSSPKALARFEYSAIDSGANRFRLVNLQPSTEFSSTLVCTLSECSLDEASQYEALSYVWGIEPPSKSIWISQLDRKDHTTKNESLSQRLLITPSLEHALRGLRSPDKERTLWIDAICIDQSNLRERSEQVLLMGKIYSRCSRDLLWLGTNAEEIGRAMVLARRLVPGAENAVKLSDFTQEDWSDIESMIGKNPVWSRIWIVQELYCAPEILLCCQGHSLEWDVLLKIIEDNEEFKTVWTDQPQTQLFADVHRCFKNITVFHTIRHELTRSEQIMSRSLISLVMMFGTWGVSNPADRVYGLFNVASDADGFPIDYEKTLDEISIDFAEHVITRKQSLLLLSAALGDPFAQLRASKEKSPTTSNLPSWVMSLSKPIPSTSGLTMAGKSVYNACGTMDKAVCQISADKKYLVVTGRALDTIASIKTASNLAEGETARHRWVRDVREWVPEDTHKWLYEPTNEMKLNAYWRTITADRYLDKRITQNWGWKPYSWYETLEERVVPEEQVVLPGWRFGHTTGGLYCFLPPTAQEGDLIAIFFGSQVPFLLRPIAGEPVTYRLVGEAYVHGFMDGQVKMADADKKLKQNVFIIE